MKRGDIIRYVDMTIEEGFAIQRGMNFNVANKEYGIILMSVRPNAPYADRFEDDGTTIIYEGHDVQKNYVPAGKNRRIFLLSDCIGAVCSVSGEKTEALTAPH